MKQYTSILMVFALFSIVPLFTGCERRADTGREETMEGERLEDTAAMAERGVRRGAEELGERAEEAVEDIGVEISALANYTFDRKDEYQDRAERIIDRFENRLGNWKEEHTGVTEKEKADHMKTVNELEAKVKTARDHLDKLDNVTSANWTTMKKEVDQSIADLRQSFQKHGISLIRAGQEERREGTEGTRGPESRIGRGMAQK